jgi:hypothetical protein
MLCVCTFKLPYLGKHFKLYTCSYDLFSHNDPYYHLPKYLHFLWITLYSVLAIQYSCTHFHPLDITRFVSLIGGDVKWYIASSSTVRFRYEHNNEQQQHGRCCAEQPTVLFLLHVLTGLGWKILELYINMYCLLRNTLFFSYIVKIGAGIAQSV